MFARVIGRTLNKVFSSLSSKVHRKKSRMRYVIVCPRNYVEKKTKSETFGKTGC